LARGFIKLIVFNQIYIFILIYILNRFSLYVPFPSLKHGDKMEGLCLLCKEPITNPLSPADIGKHIEMWLPAGLKKGFLRLNSALTKQIREFCRTGSGLLPEQLVCLHCYIKEIYHWLKWEDKEVAGRFISVFSFGYRKEGFERDLPLAGFTDSEEDLEFGICDECGEYCDSLRHSGGEWLCGECEKYG
jgi:hypothetical protein